MEIVTLCRIYRSVCVRYIDEFDETTLQIRASRADVAGPPEWLPPRHARNGSRCL